MAHLAIGADVGGVIERLEAALHAINDARIEAGTLERELPTMRPGERLVAERRRLRLRREITAHAAKLLGDGSCATRSESPDLGAA
jgi:hypothetical protein